MSIGFFFIWIFLRQLTPEQRQDILVSFRNANYSWVLLSVVAGALSHLFRAARWRILMNPMGYYPRLHNTFFAVMIGYLANLALPRLGEVTRCGILHKYEKIPVNKSFGTVIAERSVDMIFFLIFFFVNLAIFWSQLAGYVRANVYDPMNDRVVAMGNSNSVLWIAGIVITVLIVTIFILRSFFREAQFYLRVKKLVQGFVQGFKSVLRIQRVGMFFVYSILIWIMYFLMVFICFFAMKETAHLGFDAGLSVLIFGSIGIMIVQGGIGVYPAIVAETLAIYGISEVKGYALGWITWSAQNVMIVVLGVVSLILLPLLIRKHSYVHTTEKNTEENPELEASPNKS